MLRQFILTLALINSMPSLASEHRDLASQVAPKSITEMTEVSEDRRSFFEPKTEADVFEMATLSQLEALY